MSQGYWPGIIQKSLAGKKPKSLSGPASKPRRQLYKSLVGKKRNAALTLRQKHELRLAQMKKKIQQNSPEQKFKLWDVRAVNNIFGVVEKHRLMLKDSEIGVITRRLNRNEQRALSELLHFGMEPELLQDVLNGSLEFFNLAHSSQPPPLKNGVKSSLFEYVEGYVARNRGIRISVRKRRNRGG